MCKFFYKNLYTRGFSLVEMLVYVSILSIVSGGALTLLFSLGDQINNGRAERMLTQSAQTAIDRILIEAREADLVDTFYSTFLTSPGELTLTQGTTTVNFSVSTSTLYVSENGSALAPLTLDSTTVDQLRFYHYDNGETELIRIELTLTATAGEVNITKNFSAATTLRGSYD